MSENQNVLMPKLEEDLKDKLIKEMANNKVVPLKIFITMFWIISGFVIIALNKNPLQFVATVSTSVFMVLTIATILIIHAKYKKQILKDDKLIQETLYDILTKLEIHSDSDVRISIGKSNVNFEESRSHYKFSKMKGNNILLQNEKTGEYLEIEMENLIYGVYHLNDHTAYGVYINGIRVVELIDDVLKAK